MAMGDVRASRQSPPSNLNNPRRLPSFASPTSRRLDTFQQAQNGLPQLPGLSPTLDRRGHERNSDPTVNGFDHWPKITTIRLRRLPRNFGDEGLRSMLLFAKDLSETRFVDSEREDLGFSCAIANFHSDAGAREAQERLHGKPNATNDANMIVEIYSSSPGRNIGDGASSRHHSGSSNSPPHNPLSRQSSRYSSSFQNMEKISPPLSSPTAINKDFPAPDRSNGFQNLFSPQSPVANTHPEYHRISGKAVINDDNADDETGELLKDVLGYAQNGHHQSRLGNSISHFGGLSLNTSAVNGTSHRLASPSESGFSPRSLQSPSSAQSPAAMQNYGPNGNYHMNYPRHNYPPVNPADQNPPCNTLYVGNLPGDTNEDELKQLFSKARGFKRLCYRAKTNGPMCFVEFEDISFATKALSELYGVTLHNSVRGGIRLSFSKNPLGVRSGQNTMGMHAPMSPQAMSSGFSNGMGGPPAFSTANGPPPGLSPPGLRSSTAFVPPTTYGPPMTFVPPTTFGPTPTQDGVGRSYANQHGGLNFQNFSQPIAGVYPRPRTGSFGSMHATISSEYSLNQVRR